MSFRENMKHVQRRLDQKSNIWMDYLLIPALLSLGFGPLFLGPPPSPSSPSPFLMLRSLYLHL